MSQLVKVFLDEFAKAVKEKKYEKIDYGLWRELVKEEGKCANIEIEFEYSISAYEKNPIEVNFCVLNGRDYSFRADDKSFGSFLFNWYSQITATNKVADSFAALGQTAQCVAANMATTSTQISKALYTGYSPNDTWDECYPNSVNSTHDNNWATSIPSTLQIDSDYLRINGKSITELLEDTINNHEKRKENDNMELFKGFDFGSCENDKVKMSMYGVAVQNATGTWVSYDSKSGKVMDVDILNFNGKYLYKLPAAVKDIKVGDTIIHNRKPMFVTCVDGGKLLVIDPSAGEEKIILPTRNMFGFEFVTRIVNLFGDIAAGASTDSPFGNMLPLMLVSEGGKSEDMLPLFLMMNGGQFDMSNPMMLYFLMKDGKNNDILPLMLLANNGGFAFSKHCDCDCDKAN